MSENVNKLKSIPESKLSYEDVKNAVNSLNFILYGPELEEKQVKIAESSLPEPRPIYDVMLENDENELRK
jgi:hypothetical protein